MLQVHLRMVNQYNVKNYIYMLKVWLCLCMLQLHEHEWLKMHKAMGLISTHLVNLLFCTLKMMKINRHVNYAASYPNLVSFASFAFMFDINLWIENNHMKWNVLSHMAFFVCAKFHTIAKKNWIFQIFKKSNMVDYVCMYSVYKLPYKKSIFNSLAIIIRIYF